MVMVLFLCVDKVWFMRLLGNGKVGGKGVVWVGVVI